MNIFTNKEKEIKDKLIIESIGITLFKQTVNEEIEENYEIGGTVYFFYNRNRYEVDFTALILGLAIEKDEIEIIFPTESDRHEKGFISFEDGFIITNTMLIEIEKTIKNNIEKLFPKSVFLNEKLIDYIRGN